MKTTVDIADNIMERSRRLVHSEHVTFRELIEEGLLLAIQARQKAQIGKKVLPVIVKGRGLSPEFRNASWSQIRQAAYQGHGG